MADDHPVAAPGRVGVDRRGGTCVPVLAGGPVDRLATGGFRRGTAWPRLAGTTAFIGGADCGSRQTRAPSTGADRVGVGAGGGPGPSTSSAPAGNLFPGEGRPAAGTAEEKAAPEDVWTDDGGPVREIGPDVNSPARAPVIGM